MENKLYYTIMEAPAEQPDIPFPLWMKMLPAKSRKAKQDAYIMKHLPVHISEHMHLGISGIKISLPYTYQQLVNFGKDTAKDIFLRIIEREAVQNIVVDDKLLQFLDDDIGEGSCSLALFYISEFIGWIRREHKISQKDMHIVIIDDKGSLAGFILTQLDETLNHLTILTERPEYFEEYVQYMYENTGLIVSLAEPDTKQQVEGDIILDLSNEPHKYYRCFRDECIYIQLFADKAKTRNILAKCKKMTCYNKIVLKAGHDIVDNRILLNYLCGKRMFYSVKKLEDMQKQLHSMEINMDSLGIKV